MKEFRRLAKATPMMVPGALVLIAALLLAPRMTGAALIGAGSSTFSNASTGTLSSGNTVYTYSSLGANGYLQAGGNPFTTNRILLEIFN